MATGSLQEERLPVGVGSEKAETLHFSGRPLFVPVSGYLPTEGAHGVL